MFSCILIEFNYIPHQYLYGFSLNFFMSYIDIFDTILESSNCWQIFKIFVFIFMNEVDLMFAGLSFLIAGPFLPFFYEFVIEIMLTSQINWFMFLFSVMT